MNKPKLYAKSSLNQLSTELVTLFVLTTVAVTHLMDTNWLIAASLSPFVMLGAGVAIALMVEVLWMVVVGVDRLGNAVGIRKSPLA